MNLFYYSLKDEEEEIHILIVSFEETHAPFESFQSTLQHVKNMSGKNIILLDRSRV